MSSVLTATAEIAIPTAQLWAIDSSHSQVGFAVKHLMITNVKGRFPEVTGSIRLDPALPDAVVDVVIGVASITTGDEKRDAHLKSADFFDAEVHPVIQFRGGRTEGDVDGKFTLHGDLSIRGVTRPVILSVVNEGAAMDPWGNERVGFTATATIHRKDYGLEWNVALETGGVLVGDEVKITIETELVRQ